MKVAHVLPYFPFEKDVFGLYMGVKPLGEHETIFEVDSKYRGEIALKTRNLEADARYRVQATPDSEAIVWDCLETMLPVLATEHPDAFTLTVNDRDWHFENRILGTTWQFRMGDSTSLPVHPIQWLGMQVQEDLCLLDGVAPGAPLVAGCLCFPSMWSLDEKVGKPLLEIHAPVPFFQEKIARSTMLLMDRLKASNPVWRINWGIYPTSKLDLEPCSFGEWEHSLQGIDASNVGERLHLRVERQTLTRLPTTRAILFTIRTYIAKLADVLVDEERRTRALGVLRTVPPESQRYKRLEPYLPELIAYLER